MPKKLMDCVKKVQDSGKSESEAWAICTKSTGLKKEKHDKKKAETIQRIIALANQLDESGHPELADALDKVLQKEAQWQWMKEKGQQLKNWYQTEKEMDKDTRGAMTKVRQNHWDLVKQINDALKRLSDAHKRLGTPQYDQEVKQVIQSIQDSIGPALGAADKAVQDVQSRWQQKADTLKAAPAGQQPAAQPVTQPAAQSAQPGAALKASLIPQLLKLADKMDEQGEFEVADKITEVLKTAQFFQQTKDKWKSILDPKYQEKAQAHWNLVNTLKAAYDALQASGKNMGDLSKYIPAFRQATEAFQNNMKGLSPQLQVLAPAAQPEATPEEQPTAPKAQEEQPTGEMEKTQLIPTDSIKLVEELNKLNLKPDQLTKLLDTARQMTSTPVATPAAPVVPKVTKPVPGRGEGLKGRARPSEESEEVKNW